MDIERKDLSLQLTDIKAAGDGDTHTLEGYASVFGGTPDSYGDLIVKGAFTETLRLRTPKFLWQHNMELPIGKVISLAEDDHGLYGKWQLAKTIQAKDAYEYIKEGLVDGLSIGFITLESEYDTDGNRLLKKLDLREVSAVTMPANERALIAAFKSDLPIHLLLKQATENVTLAVGQAKAYTERRASEGRAVTDRYSAALDEFLAAVEAAEELSAPVVVVPEAKADASQEVSYRLAKARRDLLRAGILKEAS